MSKYKLQVFDTKINKGDWIKMFNLSQDIKNELVDCDVIIYPLNYKNNLIFNEGVENFYDFLSEKLKKTQVGIACDNEVQELELHSDLLYLGAIFVDNIDSILESLSAVIIAYTYFKRRTNIKLTLQTNDFTINYEGSPEHISNIKELIEIERLKNDDKK